MKILKTLLLAGMMTALTSPMIARHKSSPISIKKTVVVKVSGLNSKLDADRIKKKLRKSKAIKKVKVNWKAGEIEAEIDLAKISEKQFREKIEKLGYEVDW